MYVNNFSVIQHRQQSCGRKGKDLFLRLISKKRRKKTVAIGLQINMTG